MRITTSGIGKLINDLPANLMNRRSKGMLHLGRKEGNQYLFTLAETVQMVIINSLSGYLPVKDAHYIGEDEQLTFVLNEMENEPFVGLDRLQLCVSRPSPLTRIDDQERIDFFMFAGRGKEAAEFNWAGVITRTEKRERIVGLKRQDSDLTDLLSPIMLTFDLRSLTHDVRAAVVKMLPQSFG